MAPAVFGSEYAGYEEDAAQTVYLPCKRVRAQDRVASIELRKDGDERLVMLAYSSLENLVVGCGEAQAWIAVPTDRVSQIQQEIGAELVLWDLDLPAEIRRQTEEGNS